MALTYVSATIMAKDEKEAEVEKVLMNIVADVRAEEGCIRYDLHKSDYGNAFFFYEIWESPAHLAAHGKTPHMEAMGQALAGLVAAEPIINTWEAVDVVE